MKSIVISFNQTHFRVYCIKKSLLNYERLGISITLKRTDNTISPPCMDIDSISILWYYIIEQYWYKKKFTGPKLGY